MTRWISLIVAAALCVFLLSVGVSQEPAIGGLRGRLVMKENGKPLAEQMVMIETIGNDESSLPTPRYDTTDKDGIYEFTRLPVGTYRLSASTKAHNVAPTAASVEEGKVTTLDLSAAPGNRHLEVYASKRVFLPDQQPTAELHGFIDADTVHIQVNKVDPNAVVAGGGLNQTLSGWIRSEIEKPIDEDVAKTVFGADHKITKRDAEGVFVESITLPKLPEGIYWIHCSGGQQNANVIVNVTKLALVTKTAARRVLCYVVDLQSGQPVPGAEIVRRKDDRAVTAGTTDSQGMFETDVDTSSGGQTSLLARQGPSTALCDFWAGNDGGGNQTRIYTYTERPVYRPGDAVFFKGMVRTLDDVDYKLPVGNKTASVKVLDPQENVVTRMIVPISNKGTFFGSFTTSSEADPGSYQLAVEAFGASDNHYFPIASFRKPEFTVNVKSDQPWVVFGDKASATVECKYYFGGPVVGAEVSANIYRSPHWSYQSDEDEEEGDADEGDYTGDSSGEYSQEVKAVTDENGRAVIQFPTRTEDDPKALDADYDYHIYANVTEAGNKYQSAEGSVPVVQAAFALDVSTDIYVASVGDTVPVTVTTSSHDDDKPIANQPVAVTIGYEEWQNGESNYVTLETKNATTDQTGKAVIDVSIAKNKSLTIRASANDSGGREAKSETSVYVIGNDLPPNPQAGKLTLTLDRKSYVEGQNAKLVIQSESPGGTALVTVEADRILSRRTVQLGSADTEVSLPVLHQYLPNAFVSVVYIHKGAYAEASKRLAVDLSQKRLNIAVTPDRKVVKPGESVKLTIRATDDAGKPTPAEISVGVVDESIYAIRKDSTNPLRAFYPKRYNSVSTSYSFAEIYLDGGDKSPANIPVRKKFRDTAFWSPRVILGKSGTTTLSVPLPDNLTEWRATVVGVNDNTAVGVGTGSVVARKDLMVRLQLPTFLVQGDTQEVTAIVNNDTGRDADVHVSLAVKGAEANGDLSTKLSVPAGKPQSVAWTLATPTSGKAVLTAKAWIDGGANDGVEQTIPIEPHGRLVRRTESGATKGDQTITFRRLANADPNGGGLTVIVSPGLLGISQSALASLVDFPYGCTEQTMSRFMPSVLISRLMTDPEIQAKVPRIAADSISRLAKMQHEDGGWGWWEHDDSNLFMTAYVLDGLNLAREAGYPSDSIDTKKAVEWAKKRIAAPEQNDLLRDRIYLAYGLTVYGATREAEGILGTVNYDKADASTLAYAILAYDRIGKTDRRDAMLERLVAEQQAGPAGTRLWANGKWQWGAEGTAVPLRALATFRPNDASIPRVLQYLMRQRQGDYWYSTRDTSAVLIAFSRYMGKVPEPQKSTTVTVTLNGKTVGSFPVDPKNPLSSRVDIVARDLKAGDNRVVIHTADGSTVFYSAELRQYDRGALQAQDSSGIRVVRTYRSLAPRRDRSGMLRLLPSGDPLTTAKSGEAIQCELVVTCKSPVAYAIVEDPIPSNCRVTERDGLMEDESWDWWWSNLTIRDTRVAFFTDQLQAGENKFTYMLQAESPGVSFALPTLAQNMYDPSTAAWSSETRLEVTR